MVKNNFKEETTFFGLNKTKIVIIFVIFLVGALCGWYITSEFLQPEQMKQLNQKLSDLNKSNELLDQQVNNLSKCVSDLGKQPGECS